jgi:hypothetical protein
MASILPFPAGPRPLNPSGAAGFGSPVPTTGALAGGLQQDSEGPQGVPMMQALAPRGPFARDPVGDTPDMDGIEIEPPELADLRRQYQDYVALKQNEIQEARVGLQYYHSRQFTQNQIDRMEERHQPPIIFNRIKRKIDGIVGVLAKLRGDPKCFGRNAPDEHGAELATQCIRYALDACNWTTAESELLRKGCCTGIVVAELGLTPGDKGDPDADLAGVDVTTFFYDPRSVKLDFSDARYMGTAKLVTRDEFEEIFPGRWDEGFSSTNPDSQTQFDYDKEYLWSQGRSKLRLVEHWYRSAGQWRFAFYAGSALLQYGVSPFFDEKGQTVCRYDGFALQVDELGDHYGFVRVFKGPQDAINQHRSKAIWIMNTRQLKVARAALGGDGQDIERKRTEAARADGVLVWENDPNEIEIIPNDSEFLKQTQYYQDAKSELDSFGPNPALVAGESPVDVSGRSLAMQQQAGLAEIGPFIDQWNGWKLRLYRKIWIQQQRNWTAERILRVTKDMQTAQYITVNQPTGHVDEYGRPILANALGNVDVEILVDEGPNTVNVQADAFDTLSALSMKGQAQIPAPVLIELSGLPRSVKDKVQQMLAQPDPAKQALMQAQMGKTQADTQAKTAQAQDYQASAVHKMALAHHEVHKAHGTQMGTAADTLGAAQDAATHPANMPPQPQMPGAAPGAPPPGGGPPPAPNLLGPLAATLTPQPVSPPISPPMPGLGIGGPGAGFPGGAGAPLAPPSQSPAQLGAAMPLPGAGMRPQPGGPPVRAPDGHFYVHRPHAGGLYHRVVLRPGARTGLV